MRLTVPALLAAVAAAPVAAQRQPPPTEPGTFAMSKEYRAVQASALATQRRLLLSMADSMPERLYADRATPAQRTFAGQIHHIARSSGLVAAWWLTGVGRPHSAEDSAAAVGGRAGLKAYVNAEYDYLDRLLASQSDADRDVRVQFFGGAMIPRWQVWDELNQHALWTAGQVVANFRKHGMAPPPFLFF
jgi:hypothetical protein